MPRPTHQTLPHYLHLVPTPTDTTPLMTVRLSTLREGAGWALGVSVCHALMDGAAFYRLVRAWGRIWKEQGRARGPSPLSGGSVKLGIEEHVGPDPDPILAMERRVRILPLGVVDEGEGTGAKEGGQALDLWARAARLGIYPPGPGPPPSSSWTCGGQATGGLRHVCRRVRAWVGVTG